MKLYQPAWLRLAGFLLYHLLWHFSNCICFPFLAICLNKHNNVHLNAPGLYEYILLWTSILFIVWTTHLALIIQFLLLILFHNFCCFQLECKPSRTNIRSFPLRVAWFPTQSTQTIMRTSTTLLILPIPSMAIYVMYTENICITSFIQCIIKENFQWIIKKLFRSIILCIFTP